MIHPGRRSAFGLPVEGHSNGKFTKRDSADRPRLFELEEHGPLCGPGIRAGFRRALTGGKLSRRPGFFVEAMPSCLQPEFRMSSSTAF